ncbi:hypothetical protein SD457_04855 [Coprobacillaceae bacterium CR2/5/TPMF4]|nr:hypothetical protein SD457_04855 [Coprobacillaceae bacterium CR2/5/TPMF4]
MLWRSSREKALRAALQQYCHEFRGLSRPVDHYIIGAGFQILLYHICSLFKKDNLVGIEEGGFKQAGSWFFMTAICKLLNYQLMIRE